MRRLLRPAFPFLHLLRRIYWRVARPRTHGVRVLIRRPGSGAVLLVRHSYGRRHMWYPPGGGYDPVRETPEDAARREVREEVGIVLDSLTRLGTYRTRTGGNRDTVELFLAASDAEATRDPAEILEVRWAGPQDMAAGMTLARVTRHMLTLAPERPGGHTEA